MKLIYRTRGDSTPQGKPRVFFTGCPADMPVCAGDIFADILKTQNCTIYYDAEPEIPCDTEDLLREVEQMQLIVIPVTSRFLYQASQARDVVFPFAMEHRIPILPLMQERGLETAFNERCGDLQMLNKYDRDPTALPYEEKLESFLSSVLVGEALAEKVRAAFDAYVFLSYRKKDRKYAQELMRLIHKNDFCRDIAIWYDEFLTPGENFNEAITDALKKCSLFTLAVTPNVMEPGNYIMSREYPEAKKAGKPILPVELVPTNKEALQSSFQDIPPCTDAYDECALSAALLEALQKLAVREKAGLPEHDFFIGLAYLNGVDVEIDHARALSLITDAAEGGLPEAMEKLVNMYRSGGGVKRDYHTAILWQERLVDLRRAQYEESCTEDDGGAWIMALWNLGDYRREAADLPAAKQAYEHMRSACEELKSRYGSVITRARLAVSCDNLGGICEAEGNPAGAEEYYLRGLEIRGQLYEETGIEAVQQALIVSYSRLGGIKWDKGDLTGAKAYCLRGLELTKQLYEETRRAEIQRSLLVSYDNLGGIKWDEGDLTGAKEYYLRGLELARHLCGEAETAEARQDLAFSYEKLGVISLEQGDLAGAKAYHLRGLEIRGQLCEETGTVQARRDLAASYDGLGDISEAECDLAGAREYYLRGLEIRSQLREETGTVQARRELAVSYERLGGISLAQGGLAGAKEYFLRGLELARQLCEETGTVQARRELAVSYEKLGGVSREEGDLAGAKDAFLRGLEIRGQLCEETGTVEARRDLSVSYEKLGDISRRTGDLAGAKDFHLRGLEIRGQLCKETGTVGAWRDLSIGYVHAALVWKELGDLRQSADYAARAFRLSMELYRQTQAAGDYDQAAYARFLTGAVSSPKEQQTQAFIEARDIWRQLAEQYPRTELYAQRRDMVEQKLGEPG